MKLDAYLTEIEHAVNVVMAEIYREDEAVQQLQNELSALEAATEDGYRRADFLAMNPDLDDDGLGTAIHWDTYFGVDKQRFHKNADLQSMLERISAHEFSRSALCGNLLQYGKQGLSIQFGKHRAGCPEGRQIAGLAIHEIIWQGRNQALHWEDGTFSSAVSDCFEHLITNCDAVFAEYKQRSLAYEVVRLLGWKTADDLMRDMRLFVS